MDNEIFIANYHFSKGEKEIRKLFRDKDFHTKAFSSFSGREAWCKLKSQEQISLNYIFSRRSKKHQNICPMTKSGYYRFPNKHNFMMDIICL